MSSSGSSFRFSFSPSTRTEPLSAPPTSTTHSHSHSSPFSFRTNFANRFRTRSPAQRNPAPAIAPPSPPRASPDALPRRKCPCCSTPISLPPNTLEIQCSTCRTLWHLSGPSRPTSPTSPNEPFTITHEQVRTLRSFALAPDQLKAFNTDPKAFLRSAPRPEPIEAFYRLAQKLVTSLFQSSLSLTSAFSSSRSPTDPAQSPIGLRIRLARAFFTAIISGPGGRQLLATEFSKFLSKPGHELWSISHSQIESSTKNSDWAWASVLFECAGILAGSGMPISDRFSNTSRLLGLISNLPNEMHRQLVWLYKHPDYPLAGFEEKITEINGLIGDRLVQTLLTRSSPAEGLAPTYTSDWVIVAASRVMSLLFAANLKIKKVPVPSFYNTAIDLLGPSSLSADFEHWERSSTAYALCGYPCLLSIGAKISMLTHEGKRQMGAEARQALVDGLLGRRFIQPVLQISVRRTHLIEDSLRAIEGAAGELKKLLKICFVGEEGLDGGGLKKEWFLLLIRQLVAPEFGMFIHEPESHQIWFNPASHELSEFRLIGTVVGLAIYNRATLDICLPLVCYKKLLGQGTMTLEDLEGLRPGLARGLRQMLDWDSETVEETFCRTMVGEYEGYDGTVVEVPLVPGGEAISINGSNRDRFVDLYVDFHLNQSVHQQFSAFKEGFDAVAAGNALSLFQPEEIELVVSGSRERLDIDHLASTTEYENYERTDETVKAFWTYVSSLDEAGERKLLSFITGTDRIPAVGLQLKISREPNIDRLPSSHTCFNQLLLPALGSAEMVAKRLEIAMGESEGFGLH